MLSVPLPLGIRHGGEIADTGEKREALVYKEVLVVVLVGVGAVS